MIIKTVFMLEISSKKDQVLINLSNLMNKEDLSDSVNFKVINTSGKEFTLLYNGDLTISFTLLHFAFHEGKISRLLDFSVEGRNKVASFFLYIILYNLYNIL